MLLHPSTMQRLADYARVPRPALPDRRPHSFFISTRGTRPGHPTFYQRSTRSATRRPGARVDRQRSPVGHTICATRSLSRRCSAGTAPAATSRARMPLLSTYLGHVDPAASYWYLSASPDFSASPPSVSNDSPATSPQERATSLAVPVGRSSVKPCSALPLRAKERPMTALAPTLQAFFTDRLINQRDASPHTIAAYRDTFRLLLAFTQQQTGKQPSALDVERSRRVADHGIPRPPRARAQQQPPDPERAARCDPLTVPIRRAATPRARGRSSRESSQSRPSGSSARSSPTSPHRRSTRSSPRPTERDGSAVETTPSSRSRSRPGYACRS